MNQKPIAIIGAGIAGLTAANYLHQQNVPFTLYEAGKKIAGLASSFKDDEGFSYDFGAHFVTNRLAEMIGVLDDCKTVKHYSETVLLDDKTYSYPFGLLQIPRMTISGIKSQISSNGTEKTAQNWFRSRYGKALADEVALPLIEAWSGAKAEELSSSVGESLPGSIAKTIYLKLASKVLKKAVCIGYSRELPESPKVWHVYPNEGVHTLCEKLAENIQDKIKLESPIEEVLVENDKVIAVCSKGETQAVSAVISTAPANILSKLVKGTDKLEKFSKFKYRPMTFVNMRFEGRGLLPDVVLWLPENKFPFFRLTEATLSMPWLAPEGKTLITVDIGCEKGDEFWTMDNEKLGELCLEHLSKIIPNIKEKYLGCHVLRTPISYPVFLKEYEQERLDFEKGTGIENLLSVGRNGEFAHIFMEDVYWRTLQKTRNLIKNL
jgi:protoporphyrinogen/coproporphyrinogen III oxidase